MSKQAYKRLRRRLNLEVNRKPLDSWAWPGGYPLFYLTEDCAALCPDCVNAEIDLIDAARPRPVRIGTRTVSRSDDKQWNVIGAEINYEDANLTCEHCNKRIESAYAEDESPAYDAETIADMAELNRRLKSGETTIQEVRELRKTVADVEPVNLDGMSLEDVQAYRDDASKPEIMRQYAATKAIAMVYRLDGQINDAIRFETMCDALYQTLPKALRW